MPQNPEAQDHHGRDKQRVFPQDRMPERRRFSGEEARMLWK
jgi:hypothetical protein